MTVSLWALLNNLPNWPGDDCDNEVTPHQAEDQGAGEEEVEDGDLKFSNVEWEDGVAGISGPK